MREFSDSPDMDATKATKSPKTAGAGGSEIAKAPDGDATKATKTAYRMTAKLSFLPDPDSLRGRFDEKERAQFFGSLERLEARIKARISDVRGDNGAVPAGTLIPADTVLGQLKGAETWLTIAWIAGKSNRPADAWKALNIAERGHNRAVLNLIKPDYISGLGALEKAEAFAKGNRARAKLPRKGSALKAEIQAAMAPEHAAGVPFETFMERWDEGEIDAPVCTDLGDGRYRVEIDTRAGTFKTYTRTTLENYYYSKPRKS